MGCRCLILMVDWVVYKDRKPLSVGAETGGGPFKDEIGRRETYVTSYDEAEPGVGLKI